MRRMSRTQANGSMCDTTKVRFSGAGLSDGMNSANCVRPKAVRTAAILVSWLKSKLRTCVVGNVDSMLESVTVTIQN